jgi:ring-1,2-phenylacetyl-CoA epoxidase subunit PaaD
MRDVLLAAVSAVRDPELGDVTIGDLGLVRRVTPSLADREVSVAVELVPTFLGCPALGLIERDVIAAAVAAGATRATVVWSTASWDESMVTPTGRQRLAALNITVGDSPCPRCGSGPVAMVAVNGATSCRSLARCEACHEIVDVLRSAGHESRFAHPVPVSFTPGRFRRALGREEASYANL